MDLGRMEQNKLEKQELSPFGEPPAAFFKTKVKGKKKRRGGAIKERRASSNDAEVVLHDPLQVLRFHTLLRE